MRVRVLTAAVLLPVVLAAAVLGNPWWGLLVTVVALLALREQAALAEAAGSRAAAFVGYPLAAALALDGLVTGADLLRPALATAFVAAYAWQIALPPGRRRLADWSAAVAVPACVGLMAGFVVLLRDLPGGLAWTLLLLAMVWTNDSAAYVGGRSLGRTPFFPSVSPRKTLEGAVCGTIATIAVALAAPALAAQAPRLLGPLGALTALQLGALGGLISVAAPVGDLSESLVKRLAGAKDSGTLLPGHGGVLDRIDSFAFAAPVAYYFAQWIAAGGP